MARQLPTKMLIINNIIIMIETIIIIVKAFGRGSFREEVEIILPSKPRPTLIDGLGFCVSFCDRAKWSAWKYTYIVSEHMANKVPVNIRLKLSSFFIHLVISFRPSLHSPLSLAPFPLYLSHCLSLMYCVATTAIAHIAPLRIALELLNKCLMKNPIHACSSRKLIEF